MPWGDSPRETEMSVLAKDLLELRRLAQGGAGALTEHLLKEVALNLIAAGVASALGGL
jgi:hypothetical protein